MEQRTDRRTGAYPWFIAGLLSLAYLVSVLDRYIISVALEPLKEDFGFSDSELGLLTGTSFVILFCAASIPIGRLADIANRRLIIVGGILCWSISTILCGFAGSFWQLFAARFGVGLGEAALVPAGMSLIASYFPRGTLSKGVAVFTSGASFGRATAFLGGGALLTIMTAQGGLHVLEMTTFRPWQGLFILSGLLGVGVAGMCLLIREPPRRASPESDLSLRPAARYFWQNRGLYLRLFVIQGFIIAAATILATWMISLYVRKFGMAAGQASMIVGATSLIFGPIGALIGGWISDRLLSRGMKTAAPMIQMVTLLVGPIVGLIFCVTTAAWPAVIGYGLLYIAITASGPAMFGGMQLITPEQHRGFMSSMFLVGYTFVGVGFGPLTVGLFNDYVFHSDGAIAWSIAATFLLTALIGIPMALRVMPAYSAAIDRNA